MISVFVYLVPLARGVAVLGLVGGASPPRVVDDGIVVPQLQGPLSGVGLDELSLEAAKATPAGKKSSLRLACKTLASKSFWHRPDDLGTKALGLEVTRARPTAPLSELPRRPKRDARAKTKWFRLWSKPFGVALVAGAAGFLASLKFLAYIFAQIKFD